MYYYTSITTTPSCFSFLWHGMHGMVLAISRASPFSLPLISLRLWRGTGLSCVFFLPLGSGLCILDLRGHM